MTDGLWFDTFEYAGENGETAARLDHAVAASRLLPDEPGFDEPTDFSHIDSARSPGF